VKHSRNLVFGIATVVWMVC